MRLEGKTAIITGAASGIQGSIMGFGGASAWQFLKEGARVVITDINVESGVKTATQMQEAGFDAAFMEHDVTVSSDWERILNATFELFGTPDILVNNAGNSARFNVEETTENIWQQQMDVHAKSVFLGSKQTIPFMKKSGGGSIVNISSIYGLVGSPTVTAYHAGKGASRLLTKSIAVQYAKDNIRVNSVHPGYAVTPLTNDFFAEPEQRNWLLSRIPMNRIASAFDIVPAVVYLASDESSFVTGCELIVDGGVTTQ